MAGYVPGQQPANRSQEKEFVQAYEDVLERYKGKAGAGPPLAGARGRGLALAAPRATGCRWAGVAPTRGGRGREPRPPLGDRLLES